MAIYQLAAHCRRNRLMVDPVSPEFSFILQVWEELTAAAQLQLADLITNLDSMNDTSSGASQSTMGEGRASLDEIEEEDNPIMDGSLQAIGDGH